MFVNVTYIQGSPNEHSWRICKLTIMTPVQEVIITSCTHHQCCLCHCLKSKCNPSGSGVSSPRQANADVIQNSAFIHSCSPRSWFHTPNSINSHDQGFPLKEVLFIHGTCETEQNNAQCYLNTRLQLQSAQTQLSSSPATIPSGGFRVSSAKTQTQGRFRWFASPSISGGVWVAMV